MLSAMSFMTDDQIALMIKKPLDKVTRYLDLMNREAVTERLGIFYKEAKLQMWLEGAIPSFKKKMGRGRKGKRNVYGVREDLGIFLRSKMEANLARVLTVMYGRENWTFEEEKFDLIVRNKNKKYTPDFRVKDPKSGESFLFEVKGRFWNGDVSKMRAFFKQHPDEKLIFMTGKKSTKVIDFCEKLGVEYWIYEDLKLDYAHRVKWE